MLPVRYSMVRSVLSKLPLLLRLLVMVGLAILLLNLFVPSIGEAGFLEFVFQSSPPDYDDSPPGNNNSPPGHNNSPPGHNNSPPGPFHSPPGPFQSNLPPGPGGNGQGLGPNRHIDLHFSPPSWLIVPEASGKITIWGEYADNSKYADSPLAIHYAISKLPCLNSVQSNDYNSGRWFYGLYLITETGHRYRLQSFNPACPEKSYVSYVFVPELSFEVLHEKDIVFEVYIEWDDGLNAPSYYFPWDLVLRGEDIIE